MEAMQTTSTTTHRRGTGRKEGLMASTLNFNFTTQAEAECREFAREFPTPNVQRAIALCESGRLSWADVAELFRRSLAKGLTEVAS